MAAAPANPAAPDWSTFTVDQLKMLASQLPGPARRIILTQMAKAQANPPYTPTPVVPVGAQPTVEQISQQFLAQQAWSALPADQQDLVMKHAQATADLAVAQTALAAATTQMTDSQAQFETAQTAVQTAAASAQVVIDALPAAQQSAVSAVAAQVPGLVGQVTSLTASVTQVATDANTAQGTLVQASNAMTAAVTDAVSAAAAVTATDGPTTDPAPSQ